MYDALTGWIKDARCLAVPIELWPFFDGQKENEITTQKKIMHEMIAEHYLCASWKTFIDLTPNKQVQKFGITFKFYEDMHTPEICEKNHTTLDRTKAQKQKRS